MVSKQLQFSCRKVTVRTLRQQVQVQAFFMTRYPLLRPWATVVYGARKQTPCDKKSPPLLWGLFVLPNLKRIWAELKIKLHYAYNLLLSKQLLIGARG